MRSIKGNAGASDHPTAAWLSHGSSAVNFFILCFCLGAMVTSAIAEDRLVLSRVAGGPRAGVKGASGTPAPRTIAGAKFSSLQKDVEAVVQELGDKTVWWDVGPDAAYASIEIYLGSRRHVINSWYPLFRSNPKVAVSETRGLVAVSGPEEKRKIEEGNSAKYRRIVGLFEKAETVLQQDAGANRSETVRPVTNAPSGAAGAGR